MNSSNSRHCGKSTTWGIFGTKRFAGLVGNVGQIAPTGAMMPHLNRCIQLRWIAVANCLNEVSLVNPIAVVCP